MFLFRRLEASHNSSQLHFVCFNSQRTLNFKLSNHFFLFRYISPTGFQRILDINTDKVKKLFNVRFDMLNFDITCIYNLFIHNL